jgi:hypothetical protein
MTQDIIVSGKLELTERELLIAQHAADMAVKKMWEEFYKEGGKTLFKKILPVLGLLTIGFVMGKSPDIGKLFIIFFGKG